MCSLVAGQVCVKLAAEVRPWPWTCTNSLGQATLMCDVMRDGSVMVIISTSFQNSLLRVWEFIPSLPQLNSITLLHNHTCYTKNLASILQGDVFNIPIYAATTLSLYKVVQIT